MPPIKYDSQELLYITQKPLLPDDGKTLRQVDIA